MGCYCDMSDGPEFYVEYERTARKEHHCYECESIIEKGEKYLICAGKWDGEVRSYKICDFCQKAYSVALQDFSEECICFGHLWEVIAEYESEFASQRRP